MKCLFNNLLNKKVSPQQFLQLIVEKTSPQFLWSSDTRSENRNNRTIAVTVSPWRKNAPVVAPLLVGLTKDISSNGLCLICPFEVTDKEVVVGFYVEDIGSKEPLFFHGNVVRCIPFASGFWQLGFQAEQLLNTNFRRQMKEMVPLALSLLLPPSPETEEQLVQRVDPFDRLRQKDDS